MNSELIADYITAATLAPDNVELPFKIAILYLDDSNYDEAESWFLKAFEINSAFPELHFFYAAALLCKDKYDSALLEEELFLKYSKDPFEYYKDPKLPFKFEMNRLSNKVLNVVKLRKSILPDDVNTAYLVGLTYFLWGHEEEAYDAFNSVFDSENISVRFLMAFSELSIRLRKIPEAIDILKRLQKQNPDSLGVYLKLADIYMTQKDYGNAISALTKAFELNPTRTSTLLNLAVANRELGRVELAFQLITDALMLDAASPEAWFEAGMCCNVNFKFDSAVSCFLKAIELDRNYGEAYFQLGMTYKKQGKYNEAVDCFDLAIEHGEKNSQSFYNLGESLMLLNDYKNAALEFINVLRLNDKDLFAYLNLGRCLSKAAMYKEAFWALKKALVIKPDFIEPHYYLGLNDLKRGRLNSAGKYLTFFVSKKPRDTYAHFTLGNVYMAQGDYDAAMEEYVKAISLYPNHPFAKFNLAASYACAGHYEDAQNEFTEALALHPPETEEEMIVFATLASYQSILQRLVQAISELRTFFRRYNEVKDRFILEEKVKNRIADLFKKMLPEKIAEDLISTDETVQTGDYERRFVTVLFTDIRGYTAITQRTGSDMTMQFLNDFYGVLSEVIKRHKGTLLYFQGDAQMILFGAPEEDLNHVSNALFAAKEIKKSVSELSAPGGDPIEVAIGVATGEVSMGFINDGVRMQYTAIGDPINFASRLQVLSKEHNSDILLGETTYKNANTEEHNIQFLDTFDIKGLQKPVKVYKIIS